MRPRASLSVQTGVNVALKALTLDLDLDLCPGHMVLRFSESEQQSPTMTKTEAGHAPLLSPPSTAPCPHRPPPPPPPPHVESRGSECPSMVSQRTAVMKSRAKKKERKKTKNKVRLHFHFCSEHVFKRVCFQSLRSVIVTSRRSITSIRSCGFMLHHQTGHDM